MSLSHLPKMKPTADVEKCTFSGDIKYKADEDVQLWVKPPLQLPLTSITITRAL